MFSNQDVEIFLRGLLFPWVVLLYVFLPVAIPCPEADHATLWLNFEVVKKTIYDYQEIAVYFDFHRLEFVHNVVK